jgi:hypothetical protein
MSDITKCEDSLCPSKDYCFRFTSPANEFRQSYGQFNRELDAYNCVLFWDNGICKYCNLENGAHKMGCERNKINITL